MAWAPVERSRIAERGGDVRPARHTRDIREQPRDRGAGAAFAPGALNFFVTGAWARINLGWERGRFLGWYINFELPPRATRDGIETMDLILDAFVTPTGKWHWKDREDFERAVRFGMDRLVSAPVLAHASVAGEVRDRWCRLGASHLTYSESGPRHLIEYVDAVDVPCPGAVVSGGTRTFRGRVRQLPGLELHDADGVRSVGGLQPLSAHESGLARRIRDDVLAEVADDLLAARRVECQLDDQCAHRDDAAVRLSAPRPATASLRKSASSSAAIAAIEPTWKIHSMASSAPMFSSPK